MSDFVPANFLEMKLVEARAGQMPMPDFLRIFAASMIIVPSMKEVKERWEGFMPLVFDKQGVHMLACFTAPERNDAPRETFGYYLEIMGDKFVTSLRPGLGLVVNPGQSVGFEMSPESLTEFAKGLRARGQKPE